MKCMALLIHSHTYTFNLHPTVSEDYKKELLTFIGLKACVKQCLCCHRVFSRGLLHIVVKYEILC